MKLLFETEVETLFLRKNISLTIYFETEVETLFLRKNISLTIYSDFILL